MAEASHLAKKQELMRQELELSIAKESLDISTKLAIAETKEGVLVSFETDGSLLSVPKSVKSVSPLVTAVVDNNSVTLDMMSAGNITGPFALDPSQVLVLSLPVLSVHPSVMLIRLDARTVHLKKHSLCHF